MADDWLLSLIYAAWLSASTMPLGLMLGSSCSPCCGGCGVADGKPRTDPKDEGTWVPSGTWRGAGGVTWTFTANPGDESGETWFFYGSFSTSNPGGSATSAQQRDWGNICNWYSSKTSSPSTTTGLPGGLDKRASRLPPSNAVVHAYSIVSTQSTGPVSVKNFFQWGSGFLEKDSTISVSSPAHDSNGGAVFNGTSTCFGVINGGATFNANSQSRDNQPGDGATVNGGAVFNGSSSNERATINGGAEFYENSINDLDGVVNDGATFNDNSENFQGTINGGATFNDNSVNDSFGTVNGGATFNDAACSLRFTGSYFVTPCTKKFVAHPTDLPTCNGTAPIACLNHPLGPVPGCGCG